jgi:glycosyltransferase involved in cell wall biosynthesis
VELLNRPNSPKLTIVLYNYVQPNELHSPGGGVTVYLRNISASLRSAGHNVYILSGGDRYDLLHTKAHLVRKNDGELIIYNSPVIAPAIFSFHHPEIFLHSKELDIIPIELSHKIGSVDVFHFHNIEGLTRSFFHILRSTFGKSAFIFSAHNYNIGCPQVNLWQNSNTACRDFRGGAACINCSDLPDGRKKKLLVNRLKTPIKDLGQQHSALVNAAYLLDRYTKRLFIGRKGFSANEVSLGDRTSIEDNHVSAESAVLYNSYRNAGADLINHIFDQTIAVSKRTADILVTFGAEPSRVQTLYIGTRHAERMHTVHRKVATPDNLHIGYLGYMRRDKGFFFFLDSLRRLPPLAKTQIDVTIAAKFTDVDAVQEMKKIAKPFRTFNMFDGYTHDNLADILSPVNLGIVPPLWEDNLPQVAIEFVTHGVPLLTSNMGGAKEIANNSEFVFDINHPDSLCNRLQSVLRGELNVERFWMNEPNVRSNVQHMDELITVYQTVLESRQHWISV